jgi:hypothetical protein
MRTLQEKYNGIQEGKFSKDQFIVEARMQHPNLITRFNGYADAVSILKNRGMIQEAEESFADIWKHTLETDNLDKLKSFLKVKGKEGLAQVKAKLVSLHGQAREKVAKAAGIELNEDQWDYGTQVGTGKEDREEDTFEKIVARSDSFEDFEKEIQNQPSGRTNDIEGLRRVYNKYKGIQEARLTKNSLTDYRFKPTNDMDKYPYEQILRGLRVELEVLGVHGTPTPEEYTKALTKVSKNLAKDAIFYTNQLAGVNPKVDLHDKMVDATAKNTVDTFNGMKKATLKEGLKNLIKQALQEEEEVYEMQGPKSDGEYKSELADYLDDNQIYGYTDMIFDIMTGPDEDENSASLADFLDDHQIYGYNKGIEQIFADYDYSQHWMNQPDETDSEELNEESDENKLARYKSYTYMLGDKVVTPKIGYYNNYIGAELDGKVLKLSSPSEDGVVQLKSPQGKTGMYTEDIFESVSLKDLLN